MNKNYYYIGAAVLLGLYLLTKSNSTSNAPTTNPVLNLMQDFGITDPTSWDTAATAPGTTNGASIGSMSDPLGTDFTNSTLSALSGSGA